MALDATGLALITGVTAAFTGYAVGRMRPGVKLPWKKGRERVKSSLAVEVAAIKREFVLMVEGFSGLKDKVQAQGHSLVTMDNDASLLSARLEALEKAIEGGRPELDGIKAFVVEEAKKLSGIDERVGSLVDWATQADGALRGAALAARRASVAPAPAEERRAAPAVIPSLDAIAAMQAEFAARARAVADAAHAGPARLETGEGL
jgi:hypothetical protein